MFDASGASSANASPMVTNDEGASRVSIADRERRSGGIHQDPWLRSSSARRAGAASRAALETPEVLEGLQLTTPSMTSVVKVAILQTARIRVGIMLASRAELKGVGRAVEASTTQTQLSPLRSDIEARFLATA